MFFMNISIIVLRIIFFMLFIHLFPLLFWEYLKCFNFVMFFAVNCSPNKNLSKLKFQNCKMKLFQESAYWIPSYPYKIQSLGSHFQTIFCEENWILFWNLLTHTPTHWRWPCAYKSRCASNAPWCTLMHMAISNTHTHTHTHLDSHFFLLTALSVSGLWAKLPASLKRTKKQMEDK